MLNISTNPIVVIHCMTYNHKPYIRQCLDGFVMQKTNFPFFAIVVDDASTDNEQEVLWDFINNELDASTLQKKETNDYVRVIATHKTNSNCTFLFFFLKYNHYRKKAKDPYFKEWEEKVKYIAICEGDDYWTDPLKLQKQVDFLESHQDYGLVYTDFDWIDGDHNTIYRSMFKSGRAKIIKSFEEHLLNKAFIAPMSWVFRKELLKHLTLQSTDGSFVLALEIFLHSKVYFLSDNTCVHYVHSGSVAHQTIYQNIFKYHKGVHDTQMYYVNKYNVKDPDNLLDWYYQKYAKYLIARNDKEEYKNIKNYLEKKKNKTKKDIIFSWLLKTNVTTYLLHLWFKYRYTKRGQL